MELMTPEDARLAPGTATPAANGGSRLFWATLHEFRSLFLDGRRRSINRKVRSSNLRLSIFTMPYRIHGNGNIWMSCQFAAART